MKSHSIQAGPNQKDTTAQAQRRSPPISVPLNQQPDIAAQLDAAAQGHSFAEVSVSPAPPGTIQPKLTVGAPDDKYEDEADHVAGQVMRMPDSAMQPSIGTHVTGRLLAGRIQHHPAGPTQIQRHRDEAAAYIGAHGLPVALPLPANAGEARQRVAAYVNNWNNAENHRVGLRNAWNAPNAIGAAQNMLIHLPAELNKPIGAPAQQAARVGLYHQWIAGNLASTERNIANSFTPPGGAAPVAANLTPIATNATSAAIGHDGGHFGFSLQAFIAGHAPPPLYLSAWLWNRGMGWTQALNQVFITEIIHTPAITDVHLVSPHFVGILNPHQNNNAAQLAAIGPAGGGQVAAEIRRLLQAGFTWNGATLHR